jgi:hypothetical protein
MSRGESGRIVLEIDPADKQALYEAITKDGLTLKNWFLSKAGEYLREKDQLQLFSRVAETHSSNYVPKASPPTTPYRKKKKKK